MVVNGLAQHLMRSSLDVAQDLERASLVLEREIQISRLDIAESVGGKNVGDASALLRLDLAPSPRGRSAEPMIQVIPPREFAGEKTAWFAGILNQLVGSEEHMRGVATENAAMEAAHRRAVQELPTVKQRFLAGLKPGEGLFVKHGFPTNAGGHEFMWIAVVKWTDSTVVGQLANTPQHRNDLVMGQTVQITEAEVFDWMFVLPGGRREGGYTSEVALGEGEDID